MEGLQRSEMSFRRSGSSGMVWDDKFLAGEIKKVDDENQANREMKPARLERSRSAGGGGGGGGGYKTVKVSSPNVDPPSPKVSGCGICGMFGKQAVSSQSHKNKPRNNNRKP